MKSKLEECLIIISTLLSIISLLSLIFINGLLEQGVFTGISILLLLYALFINPITNLCRSKKNFIYNPIYNGLLILYNSFCLSIFINTLFKFYSHGHNLASNFIFDNMLIMIVLNILLFILSLFLDKVKIINDRDTSQLTIFLIILSVCTYFINPVSTILTLLNIILLMILFNLLFKYNTINLKQELQKKYFIMIIISLFVVNIIAFILLINLYIGIDLSD